MAVEFIAAGVVDDFTPEKRATIKGTFAAYTGVPADRVEVDVVSASVKVIVTITMPSETSADATVTSLASVMANETAASTFMSDSDVVVLSTPELSSRVTYMATPSPSPTPLDDGKGIRIGGLTLSPAVIGGVVAGVVALLLVLLVVLYRSRSRPGSLSNGRVSNYLQRSAKNLIVMVQGPSERRRTIGAREGDAKQQAGVYTSAI